MSECKICKGNGKSGVQITFSDKIRSQYSQKMIPLETDGSTFHKHYEPTKTIPEPNDYPNPITPTNSSSQTQTDKQSLPKLDLNNLAVIKIIAAALQEYIAIKEHGQ
jgi:hypothetical protein